MPEKLHWLKSLPPLPYTHYILSAFPPCFVFVIWLLSSFSVGCSSIACFFVCLEFQIIRFVINTFISSKFPHLTLPPLPSHLGSSRRNNAQNDAKQDRPQHNGQLPVEEPKTESTIKNAQSGGGIMGKHVTKKEAQNQASQRLKTTTKRKNQRPSQSLLQVRGVKIKTPSLVGGKLDSFISGWRILCIPGFTQAPSPYLCRTFSFARLSGDLMECSTQATKPG